MGPEDGNREVPGENKSSWSGHDAEASSALRGSLGSRMFAEVCQSYVYPRRVLP